MNFISSSLLIKMTISFGLLILGYFLAFKLSYSLESVIVKRFSRHLALLVRRTFFYVVFGLFIVLCLQNLGVNLTVFLGAAGIFTVALSFASQTAFSNLISGIFLLFEKPFKIGDTITVNGISGVVESIDLLSTKLITTDNQWVRFPNETLIKSEIFNLSYFKSRRVDLFFRFPFEEDTLKIKTILVDVAKSCQVVLKIPEPSVIINQISDGYVELKLMAWIKTENLSEGKSCLQEEIKVRFNQDGIQLPNFSLTFKPIEG